MANLLSTTTVGGHSVITTDNVGTYAITSLTDTLATVTGRGATTSNTIEFTGAANAYVGIQGETDVNLKIGTGAGSEPRMYLFGSANGQSDAGNVFIGTANNTGVVDINGNVDISGNVGIGTSSPAVKLEVQTATSNTTSVEGLRLYNAGGSVGAGVKIGLGVGATYSEKAYLRTDIVSGGSGRLFIGVNGSDRVLINNSGNVLIGTTTDSGFKLNVSGSSHLNGETVLGNFTGNDSDEWPKVYWYRDVSNSWDEGLIKASSSRGFFGKSHYGIHFNNTRAFGFFTSSWTKVFGLKSDQVRSEVDFVVNGVVTVTGGSSTNWNTAYSWGNHASAGYLTAHPSITEAADVNNSGGNVIQDLTFDENGHVTATGTVDLDSRYYTESEIDAKISAYTAQQSGSDFANGTFVRTSIVANVQSGDSFLLEITGKSYSSSNYPFKVILQGYIYNNTFISTSALSYGGTFPSTIKILEDNGDLCFWWARYSYWNSFKVTVNRVSGSDSSPENLVESIFNAADATYTKQVTVNVRKSFTQNISTGYWALDGNPFIVNGTTRFSTGGNARQTISLGATNEVALSLGTGNSNMSYIRQNGNGVFQWQTYYGGNSGQLHLQPYGGNVGIGTSSPQQKLHVDGNIYLGPNNSNNFIHSGGALGLQADGEVKIVSDVNDSAGQGAADIIFGYGSSTNTDSNQDFTEAELSTYPRVEIMRINASTNRVGIGTTSPASKLHVNGTARIEGDLSFSSQVGTWITSNAMPDSIGWNTNYGVYIGSNVGGTHYLRGNGTFTTGGSTYNLWHAGNDGSGSGLDADTVDGYHQTAFIRLAANSSSPTNGLFAIGSASSRNFIQSHGGQPLDINPIGNAVTIGSSLTVSGVITATGGNSTNWNTAYGWGNHASAGYQPAGNYFTDGDTVLNMANNDGLEYNDTNNLMYVKADGVNYSIIDSRGGSISGSINMTGGGTKISMNNGDIVGVNQIMINDPGEGIIWQNGSSGNIILAVTDDASDNILNLTGTGASLAVNGATVATQSWVGSQSYATQSYVNTQVSNLVDSAPGTLDTLNELAAALGDDANFSTTVTNSIATKVPLSGNATITGIKTFATVVSSDDDWENSPISILERDNIGNSSTNNTYAPNLNFHWRSRVSNSLWMNYLGDLHWGSYSGSGVPAVDGTFKAGTLYAGSGQITSTKVSNWDTAYSWGNHASAGYLTSSSTQSKYLRSDTADTATGFLTLSGGANISGGVQGSNSLMHSFFLPQNPEGSHVKAPWFFNDMAYARLRGATVSVTVNGGSSPSNSNIDAMLDASTGFWNMATSGVTSVVIEMTNLPKTMYHGSHYGVTFGNTTWRAKNVVIETYYNGAWQEVKNVTNQSQEFVYGSKNSGSNAQTKLRWTFSNFNTTSMRIVSLFAYNYNAVGMPSLYLTKDGGQMYGDIDMGTNTITDTKVGNWDTAYGWGNHSSAGYLTSFDITTQTDPKYLRSNANDTMSGVLTITGNNGASKLRLEGTTPTIDLDDADGDSFYIHINSNNFYILVDRDGGGNYGTWETPHPLQLEADTNIGYLFGSRMFADNYHPNADKWTTARTLSLTGDVTGSVSWDGSGNASITTTVADDSHNHTISNVDGLQTALDGKLSTSAKAADSNLLDGLDSSAFLRSNASDTMTGTLTTPRIHITNDTSNTVNSRITVYESGSISYGMMLWNDNGTSGDWATMIYGPNQSNRKISFGKANANFPGAKNSVDELAYIDLDNGNFVATGTLTASGYNKSNWDTAYGWGNHASAGYITGYTVTSSDVTTALGYTPYQESTALSATTGTFSGDITVNGNQVITLGSNADVKFSVWSGTTYGIGMTSGVTYGGLNDYAMTFCMNNDSDRGFWWGYSGQSKSSGAMSLTTSGHLTVEDKITTSKSEIDFTPTSDTIALDIRGTGTPNDFFTVSNATGGANDVFLPIFFYKAATYGYNGGTNRYTSGVYGGGFIAAVDDTSYPNAAGAGAAMHFNARTYANNGPLTSRYLFSWGSWLTTHMAMTAGGNLLIGKTSDSGEKLQINGNAHISGNLNVDGTIVGYAPSSHTHVIADITSLQSTLDGKQAKGLLDRNGLITTNDWNTFYTDDRLRVVSAHNFTAGSNNAPDNSYNYGAALTYRRINNEAFQLYFPENNGDSTNGNRRVAFRTGWNGGWSSWRRFVDMIDNVGYVTGGNDTGFEVHSDVGYNQDPGTYFLLRGQADNNQPYALKILLTGNASGNDIEWRRLKMNGADDRMYYAPEGQDQITFEYTVVTPSDARLKDNVKNISNPIEKLSKLNGCEFDWNSGVHEGKHDIGVIAQEVEAVIPEAVGEGSDGIKSVAYDKLVPLLIESVKEQQAMIEELKQEIQNLKNK